MRCDECGVEGRVLCFEHARVPGSSVQYFGIKRVTGETARREKERLRPTG